MKRSSVHIWFGLLILIPTLISCRTFYERQIEFQELVRDGELSKAEKSLAKNKGMQREKNRLLLLFNQGFLAHLQQNFEASNRYLNDADLFIEDQRKNYFKEALALISNPETKPYRAEDFEAVLIHYYKALNYMALKNYESAIVECRRVNLRLQQLNDKYSKRKNRYSNDAFAHIMMGLTYEAQNDYNNAFIAYRNSYNLFQKDSTGVYFGVTVPPQLKKDILRTARLTGFNDEVAYYEKQFGMKDEVQPSPYGELVFFWNNGLGPVKGEWSINFNIVRGQGGQVLFVNEELGISFPYYVDDPDQESDITDLSFLRVAFPKYLERKTIFNQAKVLSNGQNYPLQLAEDINTIAFETLEDRFLREMGTSLLRLAIKRASEEAIRDQSETAGAIASLANAITEKADTRNWQTLPNTISYARIPLQPGKNKVTLVTSGSNGATASRDFEFEVKEGETIFFDYHSLDNIPPLIGLP